MKRFLIQFILLIIVILGATYLYKGNPASFPFVPQKQKLTAVNVGSTKINVEIADTKEKRSRGLGGRQSLATDSGMLFIFEGLDRRQFWMKNVSFPLDLIWIAKDKIVDITKSIPPQMEAEDKDLTIYQSNEPVDKVLEVNGGFAGANNIRVGDPIKLEI